MGTEGVDVVQAGFEAFASGDMPTLRDAMATAYEGFNRRDTALYYWALDPDIEMEVPPDFPEGSVFRGREAVRRLWESMWENFDEYHAEPEELIPVGDSLIVTIRVIWRAHGSDVRGEARLVHIWTLRDGKAVRFQVCRTKQQALEALEPRPC
jgi:ketosteroid isomerase-like protein